MLVPGSTGLPGATNTNIVLQRLNTGSGLTFHRGHDTEERSTLSLRTSTWDTHTDTNTEKKT